MNHDMNHYQAKTIADILLVMIVTMGLFAIVSYWPAARVTNSSRVQKQNFKNVFPSDFQSHDAKALMLDPQASRIMR